MWLDAIRKVQMGPLCSAGVTLCVHAAHEDEREEAEGWKIEQKGGLSMKYRGEETEWSRDER
eukprot:7000287-Pyramimonas_sp.AAC.1